MSFRCQTCNEVGTNRVRPIVVVTELRRVFYPSPSFGDKIPGWEIVKEKRVCATCSTDTEDVGDSLRVELRPFIEQRNSRRAMLRAKARAEEAADQAAEAA